MELNLTRDVMNKKGFYKYVSLKKTTEEFVTHLINELGDLVTTNMEKAEVLDNFCPIIFTGNCSSHMF